MPQATDWLDQIEAQLDSTVPYYLPALIAELREARQRAAEDAATIAALRADLKDAATINHELCDTIARRTQELDEATRACNRHTRQADREVAEARSQRDDALMRAEKAEQEQDEARQIAFTADGEHVLIPNELSMPELVRSLVRAVNEAEGALAALREATTWQPMETAPKDGRAFLAATRFLGQPCVERIYWDHGWKGAQGEQRFDAWMPLPPPPPEEPR